MSDLSGRHTVRALSQEVWSSGLAAVYPTGLSRHRAICAPVTETGQRRHSIVMGQVIGNE